MPTAHRDEPTPGDRNQPRRPRQKRGIERYEAILDAAHELLAERPMSEIGLHDVARRVGCAPATVYHLIPSTNALFLALAERYANNWVAMLRQDEDARLISSWHDILRHKFEEARAYYNANPQAMEVYLGLGTTREIRARDRDLNREFGAMVAAAIRRLFRLPEDDYLDERFARAIEISDAFWSLSYARHHRITDEFAEDAQIAVFSYLQNFVPSYLPRVEPSDEVTRPMSNSMTPVRTG